MLRKAIYNPQYREVIAYIGDMRKRQGLTQSALGKRMRLSRQTIQKIETCEVRLDLVRYVSLCRILGINAGQLLGRLEDPSDEDDPLYLLEPLSYWPLLSGCGSCGCGFEPMRHCIFAGYFTGHFLATFCLQMALINRFGTF